MTRVTRTAKAADAGSPAPGARTSRRTSDGVPEHIAVIMDGNGRWAKRRAMPRNAGHRAGVKAARRMVEACAARGVRYLTLFAFSSENFNRPAAEVGLLMKLFIEALQREVDDLHRNDVRLRFVGAREQLAAPLREQVESSERRTADNNGLQLFIAVAYGGRWDLAQAARSLACDAAEGKIDPGAIDEQLLASRLSFAGLPDPDLLIRSGGESRISNFLLWNLAYTELYFSDLLWPDFDAAALDRALAFFSSRDRRYGAKTAEAEPA